MIDNSITLYISQPKQREYWTAVWNYVPNVTGIVKFKMTLSKDALGAIDHLKKKETEILTD